LLEAGAPVNGSVAPEQITPLMYAASSGSYETVALLLEQGADMAAKAAHGSTALDIALERGRNEIIHLLRVRTEPRP
jgi:ankyrin repeat protein